MNLPRLCNSMWDCYAAMRLFGLTPQQASRILTDEATKAVNRLPIRPYPTDLRGNDNADHEGHVPLEVADREGP